MRDACVVDYAGLGALFFFFQAEDGIRDLTVTGVQTCALPISEIRELGRATQGVTLISLDEGAKLGGLQRIVENDASEVEDEATGEEATGGDEADRKSVVLGKECRSRWSPYH